MLVSLKWLKDYVDIVLPPAELAERLTMAGLEVESVKEVHPEFTCVVTAKITKIQPHPDADKLSLCEVRTDSETLSVVCGAPNVAVGKIVPLAKVGATIPGGYTIKSSKIRGQASEGMLCSEEELQIGADSAGIMILPDDLPLGSNLADVLDLTDVIFDISITPNRADCLSIIGMAREVAAITGQSFRSPDITVRENNLDIQGLTSVKILDSDLCPRYTARMIKDVTIGPSPMWMRQRLEGVGLRSINNVVDVTNFVMMELGQPLHAFDFHFLELGRIVVRRSREGEPFVSLDGKERILTGDTLMICDGMKPIAIGGIMGGLNSEVKDDTDTILLESAYFNPASIRRSSRWLGMGTDAAFRFERGIDPEGVVNALNRAAQLIADLSGGTVCRGYVDEYPQKIPPVGEIPLRIDKANMVLGIEIAGDEMARMLESLQMQVRKNDENKYFVSPPSFRIDITREIDLIEEIARLYGYDRIPATMPKTPSSPVASDHRVVFEEKVRDILSGKGFSEVIQYSFVPAEAVNRLGLSPDDPLCNLVRIRNPLTEDQSVMRTTMLYNLLDTAGCNIHTGESDLKIFEIGRIYIHRGMGILPDEKRSLGMLLTGSRYDDSWLGHNLQADFFDLKGVVESLLASLKVRGSIVRAVQTPPFLHPGRAAFITAGSLTLGYLGEIHADIREKMELPGRVFAAEIDLDAFVGLYSEKRAYRDIPHFPAISRDVAFLVHQQTEGEGIIRLALENKEELLEKVHIFDVYARKGIPEGMKSLGLKFTYRSLKRTLTDDEVEQVHERVVKRIISGSGARIRGTEN